MLYVIQSLCSGAAEARGSGAEPGTLKMLCTMEAGRARCACGLLQVSWLRKRVPILEQISETV